MNIFQIKRGYKCQLLKNTAITFLCEKKVSKIEHVIPFTKNIKPKELKLNFKTAILKYRYLVISTTEAISISKSNVYAIKRNDL